jgi:hypothetical protein
MSLVAAESGPAGSQLSVTFENVTPGAVVVKETLPPSSANVPGAEVITIVPEPPVPKYVPVVCAPLPGDVVLMVKLVEVIVAAAPAADATANGNAAAINTAPAARAFTP